MKNKLLGLIGVIALFGFGYNTALAVVVTTPAYNSSVKVGALTVDNSSENDPVSSTSSGVWPNPNPFLQASANANGFNVSGSSIGTVFLPPLPPGLATIISSSTKSKAVSVIPIKVTAAGLGSLIFSWHGTVDRHTNTSIFPFYTLIGVTTDNPGDLVSGGPTNPSGLEFSTVGALTPRIPGTSVVTNDQHTIVWDFLADDVGKIFNLTFTASTSMVIDNVKQSFGPGTPGDLVAGATISGNLLFGSNDVLAPVGVTAVPIPAAVWLFGSALLGLFGFNKRKISL